MKNLTKRMNKRPKIARFTTVILLLCLSLVLSAQVNYNLPDCNNCPTSASGTTSSYITCDGAFPYKTIDIDGNYTGGRLLLTENGKVFVWGENGYGYTGNPQNTLYTPTSSGSLGTIIKSPMRMDLPAGVKGTKVSKGYFNNMVLGDDGLLYGWGLTLEGDGFAGTSVTNAVVSAINLPAGVTQVVDLATGDYNSSTVIIDSDGKAWFTGNDGTVQAAYNTSSWEQIPAPSLGILYTKVWSFVKTEDYYDYYDNFYFEASDGNYYANGSNGYHALGNTGLSGQDPNSGYSLINHTQIPIKVDLPAGTVVTKFDGNHTSAYALTDDGKIYSWGALKGLPTVSGVTGNATTPEELAMPSGGAAISVSPSTFTNLSTSYFQADDGGLYTSVFGGTSYTIYDTDNDYHRRWGPQFNYTTMLSTGLGPWIGITSEGKVIGYGVPLYAPFGFLAPCSGGAPGCVYGPTINTFDQPYFLSDGRFDIDNSRPTE